MFGWFVGASGLFTPCRHVSKTQVCMGFRVLIFIHTQYIHLWIEFYSSCDYHLTGITPNLMNLNSIQQQQKRKKGVETAAESSSTPMGCPFFKKKFAKWKNPSCETSVRPFLWETAARKPSGHGQDESSQYESKRIQPSNQKELPTIRDIFSIVLQLHSHILNWHELYYSSIFTLRSLLKYKLAASCFSISSVVLRNPWKEHVDLVLSTGRL